MLFEIVLFNLDESMLNKIIYGKIKIVRFMELDKIMKFVKVYGWVKLSDII